MVKLNKSKSKAKDMVSKAERYLAHSKVAISKNCWDRDWTLNRVLDIAGRLTNMGEAEFVPLVLGIYGKIQRLKYTGPEIDHREQSREFSKSPKKSKTGLKSTT